MSTVNYLKKLDRTMCYMATGDITIVLKHLKSLREATQAADLAGLNDYLTKRQDDLLSIVAETPYCLTWDQEKQFISDLMQQINLVYFLTGEPDFKQSEYLYSNRSCWAYSLNPV